MRGITNGRSDAARRRARSGSCPLPKLVALGLAVALAFFFAGCGAFGGDQNTFAPEGDVADKQYWLFIVALVPAALILAGVFGAVIYVIVRYRRRSEDEPPPVQLHGNQRLELAWTIAPAALMLGLAVPIVMGIVDLGRDPKPEALTVNVQGFQWSWTFQYPEYCCDAKGQPLTLTGTAEEQPPMRIPVDREIGIHLSSGDVIHSFWVPKLGGKLDVMPGRNNRFWLKADTLGTFPGQCAEFCGLNHAFMRFEVVAESAEDFEAWAEQAWADQQRAAAEGAAD